MDGKKILEAVNTLVEAGVDVSIYYNTDCLGDVPVEEVICHCDKTAFDAIPAIDKVLPPIEYDDHFAVWHEKTVGNTVFRRIETKFKEAA